MEITIDLTTNEMKGLEASLENIIESWGIEDAQVGVDEILEVLMNKGITIQ